MKKLFAALAGGALPSTGFAAQKQSMNETERYLAEIYRTINTAMLNADTQTLERLLDDKFTLTHITGRIQPKEEWLADVKSGRMDWMDYLNIREVSVVVTQNGNNGRIIGQAHTTANVWGAKGTWPLQLDYSAEYRQGEWKVTQAVATLF